ncbi:MAG: imidazole glycerol phosphate synthase subunit HisH [Candidatus Omnitrophica bacterium]|nr:imidazole glycerol phosphate synthase subunit HisH [Candidatus Omnitrophota bacterium]
MILIIDYGMGNIHSVQKALENQGGEVLVSDKPDDFRKADKLVLPGVGAFGDAMRELHKRRLIAPLLEETRNKKPLLGICLGLQLFFEASEESKDVKGLGLMKGRVKKFNISSDLKVPHIGWNQIFDFNPACPLLKDIESSAFVYFCHSYYPAPAEKSVCAAMTEYGIKFASLVWKDNIFGVQFHPEKSQKVGLKIIKNFVEL